MRVCIDSLGQTSGAVIKAVDGLYCGSNKVRGRWAAIKVRFGGLIGLGALEDLSGKASGSMRIKRQGVLRCGHI